MFSVSLGTTKARDRHPDLALQGFTMQAEAVPLSVQGSGSVTIFRMALPVSRSGMLETMDGVLKLNWRASRTLADLGLQGRSHGTSMSRTWCTRPCWFCGD